MDKELLDLLNEARQSGANESQLDQIVNAYNQKKKISAPAPSPSSNGQLQSQSQESNVPAQPDFNFINRKGESTLHVGDDPIGNTVTQLQSRKDNLINSGTDATSVSHNPLVNINGKGVINTPKEDEINGISSDIQDIKQNAFADPNKAKQYLNQRLQGKPIVAKNDVMQQPQIVNPNTDISNADLNSVKQHLPSGNLTDQLALQRVKKEQDINDALSTSQDINEAALKYEAAQNPQLQKQITFLQNTGQQIPDVMAGQLVTNFINQPDVQQKAHQDPNFASQLAQTQRDLLYQYPEFGKRIVAQKISQAREDAGLNNPIANIPTAEGTNKVVADLVAKGQLSPTEQSIYENQIKPSLGVMQSIGRGIGRLVPGLQAVIPESPIATPGFLENTENSYVNTLHSMAHSLEDVGQLGNRIQGDQDLQNANRLKQTLQNDYSAVSVNPKGFWNSLGQSGGQMTGFVLPMIMGGAATKAIGAGATASELIPQGLVFEGQNKDNALKMFPNDPSEQFMYTTLATAGDLALGKLLPTGEAREGAKNLIGTTIKNNINDLVDGKITQAAAKQNVLETITNYLKKAGVANLHTGAAMAGFGLLHNGLDAAFGGRDVSLEQTANDAIENFKTGFIGGIPISMVAAASSGSKLNGKVIREMAQNPDHYAEVINNQTKMNPDLETVNNEKLQNLQDAALINNNLDQTNLTDPQKEKYLVQALNQKVWERKAAETTDDVIKQSYLDKANQSKLAKEKIYAGLDKAPEYEKYTEPIQTETPIPNTQEKAGTTNEGVSEVKQPTEETVSPTKEGFTQSDDLNKMYAGLKGKYGDKKGSAIYEAANRLVNPNKNEIIEIRGNGVVVKEGDKYLLKPFGNTDENSKKWTLYKGLDVSDQFTKQPAENTATVSPTKTEVQGIEESKFPKPEKPIHEMNSDELDKYAQTVRDYNRGLEKEFFGEEGAKKYREAQSISNNYLIHSSDPRYKEANALIDKMENSLTEQQKNEFYGMNAPDGLIYDDSEIRDIGRKVRNVEDAENVDELSTSVKNALSGFNKDRPSNEKLAILNAAKKKAVELKIDPKDLIKKVLEKVGGQYKDVEDAEFMMKNAYENLTNPPQSENKGIGSSIEENNSENKENDPPINPPKEDVVQGEPKDENVTGIKNEIVDKERKKRGLEPAMNAAKKEFGDTWDNAMKTIENNPNAGEDLVNELKQKARPLTDEENAILLHRQIELQNAFDKTNELVNKAAESNDEGQLQTQKLRLAALSDALQDVYNVGKAAGTEQGRGLATRKMLVKDDYTLASMETKKRAANNGRSLTDEERAHLTDLSIKIADLEKQIDEHQKRISDLEEENKNNSKKDVEEILGKDVKKEKLIINKEKIKKDIAKNIEDIKKKLREQRGRLSANPIPVELIPDVAKLAKNYIRLGINKIEEIVSNVYDALKDDIDGLEPDHVWQAIEAGTSQTKLEAYKKSLIKSNEKLESKVENAKQGIFQKKQEAKPMDKQTESLLLQRKRLEGQFNQELEKDRLKNLSPLQKGLNAFVKWERAFKLSSPLTLAKLTMAAIYRTTSTPLEELVGGVVTKVLPKGITNEAYSEAGFNVKAEARALTQQFTQGMKDAAATINFKKGGKSDLEVRYGKEGNLPPEAADFLGHLHGALKAPIKRAAFERSMEKQTANMIKAGIDVSDPLVQTSIAMKAYEDAKRSIFMQDNAVSDYWQQHIVGNPKTDLGKFRSSIAQFLVPFAKVPTNIVGETVNYSAGTLIGSVKLARALIKGTENIDAHEKEIIVRLFKKGLVGAGFLYLGYANPNAVGGYYTGKRKSDDVGVGGLRLFGADIPQWLVHNPLMEQFQIGATVRRVADSYIGRTEEKQGIVKGIGTSLLALTQEVPFVNEAGRVNKLLGSDYDREQFADEMAKNTLEPAALQFVAKYTDSDVKRRPENLIENLKMGVPGLRQQVSSKRDYSKQDLTNPAFRFFTDRGMSLPFSSDKSIKIKDPKTYTIKSLSEYPPDIKDKYYDTQKKNLSDELMDIERHHAVYVNKFGEISTESSNGTKRINIEDLNRNQMAQVLSIAARKASVKTKQKIFKTK